MSVRIYSCKIGTPWSEAKLTAELSRLPVPMQQKISAYKASIERQSRIMGKLMLQKMISDYGHDYTLLDMKYTGYYKPYFDGDMDFSISHCDGMVICAGAMCAKIGVDTERMRAMEIQDYRGELTPSEWYMINHNKDPSRAFLETWTKKEALLKATGRGIDMEMSYIDASAKVITVHKELFSFFDILPDDDYISQMSICIDYARMRETGVRYSVTYETLNDTEL